MLNNTFFRSLYKLVEYKAEGFGIAVDKVDAYGSKIDIVQCKTTRKYNSYFTPEDWRSEVEAAQRLRQLGFEARVWLDFTLFKIGRSASINKWFRIDKHEQDALTIKYDGKTGSSWTSPTGIKITCGR